MKAKLYSYYCVIKYQYSLKKILVKNIFNYYGQNGFSLNICPENYILINTFIISIDKLHYRKV